MVVVGVVAVCVLVYASLLAVLVSNLEGDFQAAVACIVAEGLGVWQWIAVRGRWSAATAGRLGAGIRNAATAPSGRRPAPRPRTHTAL